MRVLWLCNVMLPKIAESLQKPAINIGGWLVSLSDDLLNCDDINLTICFPMNDSTKTIRGTLGKLTYYGFKQKGISSTDYNPLLELEFSNIIKDEKPDIIHIFGTEYPHTLGMVKCAEKLNVIDKVVINIQGLISICAKHYLANLPCHVIHGFTIKEIIKRSNINRQCKDFKKRGTFEIDALKRAKHVIGRTDWDRACTTQINPEIQYHFCNETLRGEFYKHTWDLEKCEKYSIFISQPDYPIKGFHFILEAMPEIIKRYPTARIFATGNNYLRQSNIIEKIKVSSYQKHIKRLIIKNGVQNNITFLGNLNEKQMCDRFLKSHVFVSGSTIENSSNSICEAMILGVPVVSSYVGGIPNLIHHGESGYFYQHDAPYMLANYVCSIFENNEIALQFSQNARKFAQQLHNRSIILRTMLAVYDKIAGK